MDTKNIERAEGKVTFQVVVDPAAFETAVNKAFLKAKNRITVPGFRRGKAPRVVIEGMYGKDVFYEDAVDSLALEAFRAGIAEAGDRTVGDPAITDYNVDDDKALTISFESTLYPEVTLGEYKGLKAYREPVKISADEVKSELETIRKRNARIVTVDRGAKNGDTVIIDFDGYRDGKRFDGGKAEGQKLVLGSGSFVPGFEEQLIGVKAGEERDLDITFPEDYAPELAGAAVVFKVKVHEVQETQLPELDDEFAKDVSEFDTLKEYKASIKKDLEARRKETAEGNYRSLLIRKATENMQVEIPDVMINSRVNAMLEDMARRCAMQGMTLEQYLQMMGVDERIYRSYIRPTAANDVRTEILLEKVAEAENIEITPEEIEQEYKDSAERYGVDADRMKKGVPEDVIASDLKMKKAGDVIFESGIPTDEPEDGEKTDGEAASGEGEGEEKPAPKKKRTTKKAAPKPESADMEASAELAEKPAPKKRRTTKKAAEAAPAEEPAEKPEE